MSFRSKLSETDSKSKPNNLSVRMAKRRVYTYVFEEVSTADILHWGISITYISTMTNIVGLGRIKNSNGIQRG